MSNPRVYRIPLDANFDLKFAEFKRQLNENEKIVSAAPDNGVYVIMTEETSAKKTKKLLLEQKA